MPRPRARTRDDEKARWNARFDADPIDLRHLPTRKLVERARTILHAVGQGRPWTEFGGKRLQHDRSIVSVPLGRRYRVLFDTSDGSPTPTSVLSHESYSRTKPGK